MKRVFIILLLSFHAGFLFSQDLGNEMYLLSQIKEGVKSKRVGSFDKSGGNGDCLTGIKDGDKATIMDVKGAGIITHIWITIAPGTNELNRNDIILRMF